MASGYAGSAPTIPRAWPTCGESAKLRKQKKEFFAECEKDAYSALFFVNP